MTAALQAKVKTNQGATIGRVPYKGKKKSGQVNKTMQQCNQQDELLIIKNKPNTFNKRQNNYLSLTPDSSL